MALDHRSTNSAESGSSTTRNMPAAFSLVHSGGSSESMLWAPALAAGDEGSTSSFRLPELSMSSNAHTGYIAETEFQEDLISFEDMGVHMRYRYPVEKPSATESFEIPLVSPPFEANCRPPATGLPHEPCDDVVQGRSASDIHAANGASLTRSEAPRVQPPPAIHTSSHRSVAAKDALLAQIHDASWDTLLRALLSSSPAPAWDHQHEAVRTHRTHSTSVPPTDQTFGVRAYPPADSTTRNTLVPHANDVTMPTIGNVGGFKRTRNSFQELPGTPPAAFPFGPAFGARISNQPRPTVADFSGARHRYPPTTPPRSQAWKRTDLAADYASAIYNRAPLQATGQPWYTVRAPVTQQAPDFARQDPRPSTRGLTFTSAVGMARPPTPAQRPAENSAVRPPLSKNGKQRPRRGVAKDQQRVYARRRRVRINERMYILQQLIPDGTKVDLVKMLDEAFNYVKFLEHQFQLLSSEDNWMLATPNTYKGKPHNL